MRNVFFVLCATACLIFSSFPADAQIRTPAASTPATLKTTVGLTDVTIEYARPSARDRKVFAADGLVPFGEVWRTGANAATKLTFSDEVTLGGQKLKAGSYALLTKPGAEQWEIMVFPYETGDWTSYVGKTPAGTFTAKVVKSGYHVETFLINVNNVRNDAATIDVMWENTVVNLPLQLNVDERVTAQIQRVMAGPGPNDYFTAATYYHEAGKDLKQAYEWVKKANADNPQFWMLRRQALIEADLGMYKEAVATATRSKEMAMKANNNDYVRMNEASIADWSKKTGKMK